MEILDQRFEYLGTIKNKADRDEVVKWCEETIGPLLKYQGAFRRVFKGWFSEEVDYISSDNAREVRLYENWGWIEETFGFINQEDFILFKLTWLT